ncbi:MAG TPA: glycine betaine ABC transporter substrate-binding protein [Solirubrobacteraceae bacterium]|nr:glycine betaine ABC transporter substrate-binding protein [Solirubrobacteraceae bacterium]
MARAAAALLALLALLALGACGGGASASDAAKAEAPTIRIGTKNFTEQYLLGELYAQALKAEGFRVQLKPDLGSSEIVHRALASGALDLYPEYVGVLLSEIAGVRERPRRPRAAERLARRLEQGLGLALLRTTPFSDANALAVLPRDARRLGLRTIADLRRVPGGARIGAPPEFASRFEGLLGLAELYGLEDLRATALPIGEQYDALDEDRVDAAAVFTTDGRLADGGYVLLDDPRGVFATQHAAPVVRQAVLRVHGRRLAATLDAVSARLTTSVMRDMNAAVDLRGEQPGTVADRFLRANGLK